MASAYVLLNVVIIFRHVILPPELAQSVPMTHLMTETEWRNLGVQQSLGWEHYMVHSPGGPHHLSCCSLFLNFVLEASWHQIPPNDSNGQNILWVGKTTVT